MRNLFASTTVLAACAWLPGCSGPAAVAPAESNASQSATEPVNRNCPIMEGHVTPEGGTVIWNGQTIGFCCEGCLAKWEALTDEMKAAALAAADSDAADQESDNHSGAPQPNAT